ncbi:unnamed protein product, partial [marine sediment metagenome]
PSEIITAKSSELSGLELTAPVTRLDDYWFELEVARQTVLEHFGVATLDGYGCAHLPLAIRAAGAIIYYIQETQKGVLGQLTRLSTYSADSFMALDVQTQRNLELFQSGRLGTTGGSLLSIIDLTKTAIGGRLLKRWLGQPLLDITELAKRQDAISWFCDETLPRNQTISRLGEVADIERLINRVKSGIATPRELVTLRRSLEVIPELRQLLGRPIDWLKAQLKPCPELVALISEAIVEQ